MSNFASKWSKIFASKRSNSKNGSITLTPVEQQELLDDTETISRLSLKEIEAVVQLNHSDDWEYGNDEIRCKQLLEATRKKIGYTEADLKKIVN